MTSPRGESEELRQFRSIYLKNTDHYCPECGKICTVSDTSYDKGEIEPNSVKVGCPDCGEFTVTKTDGGWRTEDGIPYIPGMKDNSATLLYRYGDRIPETKEEFDGLIELLVSVSNGYRDCCDLDGQLETEKRLNVILIEGIKRLYDYSSQLFLNLASIIQCLNDIGDEDECNEAIKSGLELCMQAHIVDACTFLLMMTEFDMTPMNTNEMKKVYVRLRDADLSKAPGMSDRRFAAGMYYNMLSQVADTLGLQNDFDRLLDMALEAYLKDASKDMDPSDLSMIAACFESNIIFSSHADKEALAERYVAFTDKYRDIDDIHYYNALLRRHIVEANKWGDLHGKDDDLDRIIERFTGCGELDERHIYASALYLRSVLDIDDMTDLTAAYGAVMDNLREGAEFDDLACAVIKCYLVRIKKDTARYRSEVRHLNQLGISMKMVDDWYKEMSSEQ